MSIRITSPSAKIGLVVACGALLPMIGVLAISVSGYNIGSLTMTALVVLFVGFCSRTFRGPSEDVRGARPLWRMTEKPVAGYVAGGYLVLVAIGLIAQKPEPVAPAIAWLCGGILLIAAAAYMGSSLRLARDPHPAEGERTPHHTSPGVRPRR